MFKGKVGTAYVDPVIVSVRLTYTLNKFFSSSFSSQQSVCSSSANEITALPWGAPLDPVTEMILYCDWNHVAENVVLDSQNHSDFDPLLAPKWSLRTRFHDSNKICYMLRECLSEFLQLSEKEHTLFDVFGDNFGFGNATETNPLDQLTESKISKILPNFPSSKSFETKGQLQSKRMDGPIAEDILMQMLYYMFPDAQAESAEYNISDSDNVSFFSNIFWFPF